MEAKHKSILGAVLLVVLLGIGIPFEKAYTGSLARLAQDPTARLLGGVLLLFLAYHDVMLGSLAFLLLFLWLSDTHLLSSLKIV